jgi:starch synthase
METRQRIAIIDWTHCIEDYLENIALTIDDFVNSMRGGWLFGYIEALKLADFDPIFICFSLKNTAIQKYIHKPTNTEIRVLPVPRIYRLLRKKILNPYTQNLYEAVSEISFYNRFIYKFLLKISPYTATPFRKLLIELKKLNVSYILCQEYEHARFDICVLIGKLLKIPVYATFQGGNWQLSPFEKYIRPLTLNKAKGLIIASSQEIMRVSAAYKGMEDKIFTVFNPIEQMPEITESKVEARQKFAISPLANVAMWHGRIDYQRKGLDRLIDAWQCVKTPNAVLYIIGNGTDAHLLEKKINESGKRNIIWVRDYIQDRNMLYTYLKAADIYVFLSRNEGFPAAPIEAMASKLPVIATRAPGIREILEPLNESGGVLLPLHLDAATIGYAIDKMFNSDCEALGSKAQQHVRNKFSIDSVSNQFKTIFKK